MAMARANSEGWLGVSPMVRVAGSGPITRHSRNFAGETKNRRSEKTSAAPAIFPSAMNYQRGDRR
jgi:hypothetical protein